jgi:imidazolonepropionase-like amidohydrolase
MNQMLVLRAGRVFDGERTLDQATVVIQDGKISGLDTSGASPPEGAEVVDFGSDACLLPGLIDAHVHLAFDASADVVTSLAACDDGALLDHMAAASVRALYAGVTTVRDLGDRNYLSLMLGGRFRSATLPHIVAAGPPITTSGGHCYFLGGQAEGETALRAAVRERAERGCDVVKVMVSGGNLTPGSQPHESQYDLAALRIVADEAHRAGLPAAAHAHGARAVADAVEAASTPWSTSRSSPPAGWTPTRPCSTGSRPAAWWSASPRALSQPGPRRHRPSPSAWRPSSPTTAGCSGPAPRWSPGPTLA